MSWYALYTKPRWEKKVHAQLQSWGIESYCPMNRVVRQWSDRKKKLELPLFPSYVFVNIEPTQQTDIRMAPGVVNFVYWLGKPAVISDADMSVFRTFVSNYENITVQSLAYREGDSVAIETGVFKGQTAIVKKVNKNNLELILESLQAKLVVNLPDSNK